MAFSNRVFLLSGFLTLVACPPPAELASGPTQGPGGGGGEQVGEPGPNGAGDIAPKVDLTELKATFTQDALKATDHFTISGVLDGDCDGYVRVQAIEDAARDPNAGNGLVTYTDVDGAAFGDAGSAVWALAVPKDMALIINALCDGNRDGIVDLATEGGSPLEHFDALSADVADVMLVLADLVAGVSDQVSPTHDPGEKPPEGWVPPPPSDGSVPPPPSDGSVPPPPSDGSVPPPPREGEATASPDGAATPAPAPAAEAPAAEVPAAEAPADGERL